MKVQRFLLINPFYPLVEMPSAPLGVSYLAAALERAGIETRVYDLVVTGYSAKKLEALMNAWKPDIVGATAVSMTFNSAIAAIEEAKRINPDVVTAMGGAHVSFCASATLRKHKGLDLIAMGEGEELIVELCEAVAGKRSYASIAGLAYRDGDEVRENASRGHFIDVNTLPLPARDHTPLARYRALRTPISMTTSRGCPFQCIFCVGRKLVGAKVRYRDHLSVVNEMQQLVDYGFEQVNVADDLFTAKRQHALAVCDEIIKRGLKVSWAAFANVNTVDVPLLRRMKEAGCFTVSFGLESGNQDILKATKKGTKLEGIVAAVEMCNEAGVTPHGSFIVGLPGETPETIRQSIEFSRKLREMGCDAGFHMLAPFPGTAVREHAEKFQLKILSNEWSDYHANRAITETPGADRDTQNAVAKEFEGAAEELFWDLARRIEAGTASAEECHRYALLERQAVYYDMMMQDLLETRGSLSTQSAEVSQSVAIDSIVEQVCEATKRPRPMVERAIVDGLHLGYLRYRSASQVCTWEFADSPPSLAVTEIVRRPAQRTAALLNADPFAAAPAE